jgi:hypothetical protein
LRYPFLDAAALFLDGFPLPVESAKTFSSSLSKSFLRNEQCLDKVFWRSKVSHAFCV